jgi:hypothetical protein
VNAADAHAPVTHLVAPAYHGAKAVQTGFRAPTDDWRPTLLSTNANGRKHIPPPPRDNYPKEATADALTALLKRHHAVSAECYIDGFRAPRYVAASLRAARGAP